MKIIIKCDDRDPLQTDNLIKRLIQAKYEIYKVLKVEITTVGSLKTFNPFRVF